MFKVISERVNIFVITEVVMDAEVESVMASSQDQREEELQVSKTDVLPWNRFIIYLFLKVIGILNKSCLIFLWYV